MEGLRCGHQIHWLTEDTPRYNALSPTTCVNSTNCHDEASRFARWFKQQKFTFTAWKFRGTNQEGTGLVSVLGLWSIFFHAVMWTSYHVATFSGAIIWSAHYIGWSPTPRVPFPLEEAIFFMLPHGLSIIRLSSPSPTMVPSLDLSVSSFLLLLLVRLDKGLLNDLSEPKFYACVGGNKIMFIILTNI